MSLDTIDLTNKDVFVEGVPHEWFASLRRDAPVFWHDEPDGPGFWCVTRYDDLVADPEGPAKVKAAYNTYLEKLRLAD